MNPGGFINAAGLAMIGVPAAAGTVGAGATAITTYAATAALDASAATPVIGSLTATATYVGNASYNVLSTSAYTDELQAAFMGQITTSGQSILLASPLPAATGSVFESEIGFLQSIGYTQVGGFMVPPIP